MKKKLTIHSEVIYIVSLIILSLAVAMIAASDFGVSMIVAPAYVLHLKLSQYMSFTFGQAEYVVQGLLFIALCIVLRRFKPIYLTSFLTCVIYGGFLDLWRLLVPLFNPNITAPGSMALYLRIILFVLGVLLTATSIGLVLKSYLYPQVYDFFVKAIYARYKVNYTILKTSFDFSCLAVALILSFIFFGRINGIGIGTVIITIVNGFLISTAGKIISFFFEVKPLFPKVEKYFDI